LSAIDIRWNGRNNLERACNAGLAEFVWLAAEHVAALEEDFAVSGLRKPLSRLNTVVLPAAVGPMMPRISLRLSLKLTS